MKTLLALAFVATLVACTPAETPAPTETEQTGGANEPNPNDKEV